MSNEPSRLDQHTRRSSFIEAVALEIAGALTDRDQLIRHRAFNLRLVGDDLGLDGDRRIAEIHRTEALLG